MEHLSADIYRRLVNAKIFIDENFDEPIDLAMVSLKANFSVFHFHRLFSTIYKITPHQYLTRQRLSKAKQLLDTGTITISGVCTHIGFESYGSFSTLFKKHHGIAPSLYRNIALRKREKARTDTRFVIPNCFIDPVTMQK